ncbi:hypothetical protein UJ101_01082 [Flavobacteriaceae bacterium UJ101]|nr:hypothetical protein UJ101_01082 [Flavobacteriaceae bacterium UJ101]
MQDLEILKFFEFILNEKNIYNKIDTDLGYSDVLSYKINLPDKITYVESNQFGESEECEATVKSILTPILRIQFKKSKERLFKRFTSDDQYDRKLFLTVQFNIIQNLVKNNTEVINKYPYLLLPLRGLVKFMNETLLLPDMARFQLNEDGIELDTLKNEPNEILKTNEEIIFSVLEYMKGKNEQQEVILNDEDFKLLIEYTTHLINNKELPTIERQLEPNLTNDTISFTFWVLHFELYTTKRIHKYFYDFIYSVFNNFKDSTIPSIKSQFGTKSRVYSHKFLPKIILKHLE